MRSMRSLYHHAANVEVMICPAVNVLEYATYNRYTTTINRPLEDPLHILYVRAHTVCTTQYLAVHEHSSSKYNGRSSTLNNLSTSPKPIEESKKE
jgi:hypothetical protein